MVERTLDKHPGLNRAGVYSVSEGEIHISTKLFAKLFADEEYTLQTRKLADALYPIEASITIGGIRFLCIGTEKTIKKRGLWISLEDEDG